MNEIQKTDQSFSPAQAAATPVNAVGYSDPAAVAAAETAKARIQSQYMMAISRPRSYDQSRYRILEACKRPAFAEKVLYKKPVGNDVIKGPSIRFAELALREWGNIDYSNTVIYDDYRVRRIAIVITDLETNTSFGTTVVVQKTIERKSPKGRIVLSERLNSYGDTTYLVYATDDEVNTKQGAAVSRALRNEGLRLIPQEIIEEATAVAQQTMMSSDKNDIEGARHKLTDALGAIGVPPAELEAYLGHPLAQSSIQELSDLRAIYNSLKNGEAKWADFCKVSEDGEKNDALEAAKANLEQLKRKMKEQAAANDSAVNPEN